MDRQRVQNGSKDAINGGDNTRIATDSFSFHVSSYFTVEAAPNLSFEQTYAPLHLKYNAPQPPNASNTLLSSHFL